MTPEDRELFALLRRQQAELQETLGRLNARLDELERRAGAPSLVTPPPFSWPLPPIPALRADLPPLPPRMAPVLHPVAESLPPGMPPVPNIAPLPPLPPLGRPAPPVAGTKVSSDVQFGRGILVVGALFLIIFIVSLAAWMNTHLPIANVGKIAGIGLISTMVLALGQYLERKRLGAIVVARTIMAAGLAGLYAALYAACFGPLQVITNPLIAGLLLVIWSFHVLAVADRRRSETLALFAITLAYVSTALNPMGTFTLVADLMLAATAVVFVIRGWTLVPTVAVAGTYLALFRQLIFDQQGELVLDTSRALPFWPYATYLTAAWLIFTAAVIMARAPTFRGTRRQAFIGLNNAAFAGLLAVTAYIAGYGPGAVGRSLIDSGLLFLVASRFAGFAEIDPVEAMGAYAAQGLALFTMGLIVVFSGVARVFALMAETFLIGVAGAFAGDRILTVSSYVAGFFATIFAIWEMAVYVHHPWLFGFGGGLIMFINAWSCRGEVRHSTQARSTIVLSTSCFCILGLALVFTALATLVGDASLPAALALGALFFTFMIYNVTIYELPPLAQIYLVVAQALVIFPAQTGEALPWWTTGTVIVASLVLVTWWSRQRVTRSGSWTIPLTYLYSFALVALAVETLRPYLDAQQWMVAASLLAVVFFIYGTVSKVWSMAVAGQLLLALAFYHFFFPPQNGQFPWRWWAAATPVVVVYATGRALDAWTYALPELSEFGRENLRMLARAYLIVAIVGLARWVFAFVSPAEQVAAFLFLGTLVLSTTVRQPSSFGVRCSFILTGLGMWTYLESAGTMGREMATYLNGLGMLLFLAQPALLRHEGRALVTAVETWALIVFSVLTSWVFISAWVWTSGGPSHLTLGWAVFAFFLFLFGHIVRERRLRWCGLVVLFAAIVRVFCYDFWGLSSGLRVVTFLALAVIALGVGFILLRRDTRETLL